MSNQEIKSEVTAETAVEENQEPCKGCGRIHRKPEEDRREATPEELEELRKPQQLSQEQVDLIESHLQPVRELLEEMQLPFMFMHVVRTEEDGQQMAVTASGVPTRVPVPLGLCMAIMSESNDRAQGDDDGEGIEGLLPLLHALRNATK